MSRNKMKRTVIPPVGGWKEHTLYLVRVSYRDSNPIHHALFLSGFLNNKGEPAGYNYVFQISNPQDCCDISHLRFLEVEKELAGRQDLRTLQFKMPADREAELEFLATGKNPLPEPKPFSHYE